MKICEWQIGLNRSVIGQVRWHPCDKNPCDKNPPTPFMGVANINFQGTLGTGTKIVVTVPGF